MYKYFKRISDFCFALVLAILTLPVVLFVAVVLYIQNKGSIFFVQPRPGYKGTIFNIYKFKTMTDDRDETGELLPNAERITKLGSVMRKYSIDELPQLINVLKGDISVVGPRPLRVEYLDYYNAEQMRRHDVLPGITGWAQVNGRNAISWEEKFNLDVFYVDNISLALDLKIMALTIKKVLFKEDINNSENLTMPKFTGTKTIETNIDP
ncbi:MAG: sugar transferase [Allomuricauda sp.]